MTRAHRVTDARRMILACALVAGAIGSSPSPAQTASQITPPTYAPPVQRPGGPVVIPQDSGSAAPAGAETLSVRLSGVMVEGDPAASAEIASRLVGRTVRVSEVFAEAHALEVRYARAGRVLTRVVVPAQELADGAVLRLVVVEGFVERVDTGGVPRRVRGRVDALLASLVGDKAVTLRRIERKLSLASDLPGVRLRSTLAAGSVPGATVLVVEATQRPVTGFVTVDNTLPGALGRETYGVGVNLNSVLGLGETLYVRASGLPSGGSTGVFERTPRNRALASGFILPLGNDGLTFNLEGTDARTAPRHLAGLPGFGSRFRRLSGRLRYPFVRSRALTLSGEASFDAQDERVRIIDPLVLPLSLDELRIARLAGDLVAYTAAGGVASVRAEVSFGIDGLGARSAAEATAVLPLSRQGTDADFRKLGVQASFDQPLATHLSMAVRGRFQTSFGGVMANAEQIGLASADAISPLPSGTVQGDEGAVVRGELRAPFAVRLGGGYASLAPYGFGAIGTVGYLRPTFFERKATDASAWGGGLRLAASAPEGSPGVSASVEYGQAHLDGVPGHPDRFSFTFVAQF